MNGKTHTWPADHTPRGYVKCPAVGQTILAATGREEVWHVFDGGRRVLTCDAKFRTWTRERAIDGWWVIVEGEAA